MMTIDLRLIYNFQISIYILHYITHTFLFIFVFSRHRRDCIIKKQLSSIINVNWKIKLLERQKEYATAFMIRMTSIDQ